MIKTFIIIVLFIFLKILYGNHNSCIEIFSINNEKGDSLKVISYYLKACEYSNKGVNDSAFIYLELIAYQYKFDNYKKIYSDSCFVNISKDKRWNKVMWKIYENQIKQGKNYKPELVQLIDSIKNEDQKWRGLMRRYENHEISPDSITKEFINNKIQQVDSLNYFILKKLVSEYGYLGNDKIGIESSKSFWLLIQHQDKNVEFQESILNMMKQEIERNNASKLDYAYLMDRIKINKGEEQEFGTQLRLNSDSSSFELKPTKEINALNSRRKEMGLGSIEDYIKIMNQRYYGSLKMK